MASTMKFVLMSVLFCSLVLYATASPGSAESAEDGSNSSEEDDKSSSKTPNSTPSRYVKPAQPLKECASGDIDGTKKCCKLPTPFPSSALAACLTYPPTSNKKGAKGKQRDATCKAECLLKNSSVLNDAGVIDSAALSNLISSAANENWRPLINDVVTSCVANLQAIQSDIPPAKKDKCITSSEMLLVCIQRGLALVCPTSETLTSDKGCKSRLTKLSACGAYASVKSKSKSG